MTDQNDKKKSEKSGGGQVAGIVSAVVGVIALIPAFWGMATGQGPIAIYQQIIGVQGDTGGSTTPPGPTGGDQKNEKGGEAQRDLPPPPPPVTQPELPMSRMSSDARLAMTLVSLRPKGPNSRGIIATYALRSVGAPSQPFILSDGNQKGWSVEADRAGHCWQREASALDAFYLSELDAKIPQLPTMSPGQVFYIRAELSCDADPLAGDTAVATATPYVLATDGSRTAVPIRFQSARVPVTP